MADATSKEDLQQKLQDMMDDEEFELDDEVLAAIAGGCGIGDTSF